MKVVIATPILFDKASPFNHLFKDILEGFIGSGHQIVRLVATEAKDDYSYDLGITSENIKYIPFIRKKADKSNIIVRYLSDSLMNIKMAQKIRKLKDCDVLFEDVSYSSFYAVKAAKKKGIRVVAMLQDVWPDNAVQSGLIKERSLIYKFFEVWQRHVYKHADKLICISEDMKDFIVSKGVPAEKIAVIYNWGYFDEPVNIPWEENRFVQKYQLDHKKFYAVYAGNIGRMQNVQLVVKAAKLLQEQENIHFLIVGDGVMREEIEQMTQKMENVTMLPLQPQELATSIYSMASVNIIPLVPGGLKTALPSKIGVCLSCGNPSIACVDKGSKLEMMLEQYHTGCVVEPKAASNLAEEIKMKCIQKQEKNYECFKEKFTRSHNVELYCLNVLVGEKMSKLLVTVDHQFVRTPDGQVWVKTIYGYDFWKRYLNVFDSVRVACRIQDVPEINEKMLLSSGDKVEFFALPQYRGPKEFVLRYFKIKKQMKGVANGCDCALFRIPSPIANGVQKEAVKKGLPWAVEVVNDPWDTFAPGSFKSIVRPIVRVFFTLQVKNMAKRANGASYVTQFALQKRYPAAASLCGGDEKHFESYYSSIILRKDYFLEKHELPKAPYTIVHINSCITDYSKGHDVVIKTLKIIRDAGLDAKVIFVGDGPARQEFEKMAQNLGEGDFVTFTGLLSSPQEVREYLVNADLMIFPTKGEGLPRTVIESMAVGLPCLSTPVNGIPELLPEECMFEQQDAQAFAEKVIELMRCPEKWQTLSNQAIIKASEYEESILAERRNVFYSRLKQLISEKGRYSG